MAPTRNLTYLLTYLLTYKWLWHVSQFHRLIDRAKFNVPPNTLYVILGMGFYRSNDPTNSVKALKIGPKD